MKNTHTNNYSIARKKWHKKRRAQILETILHDLIKDPFKCYNVGKIVKTAGVYWLKRIWKFYYGESFPKEMQANHHCDNHLCINIFHIFPGTQKDNLQDMIRKGRGPSKLNAALVEEIYEYYINNDCTTVQLAKKFNLVQGCIYSIVEGWSWSHLKLVEKYGSPDKISLLCIRCDVKFKTYIGYKTHIGMKHQEL